ncbi:MAG: hypothetical protein Q9213_001492 [Squamulea squamosa]
MAVGAQANRLVIYALKDMERMRNEVQKQDGLDAAKFMPIHEDKHIHVDGSILKMEFLHPSEGDEHHVILLLIVSKGKRTRLLRFEWDCRYGLSELDRKPTQVLANSERVPLLLIPLTYGTSFALVCEHHITVYRDILTGNAKGQTCELEHYEPPEEPGSSLRLPIWTQWARPMRPTKRREQVIDNIYLCREDGVVRYIDIKENSHPMITSNYSAGILKANLSSAFATLDLGNESNDLLIAAGEMGDGGMWYFKPRQPLELVGTIRNWTPLRDITAAHVSPPTGTPPGTDSLALKNTKRFFACSGRGPRHGVITEIRMGTEAVKLGPTIELGELAQNGILNIWALPDRSNTGVYLMVAHPTETELILLPSSIDQDPQAASEIEELDLNMTTIAAGSTAEGYLVQVTPSSINAIAQENHILPLAWRPEESTITAASFLTIPSKTTVILTVLRKHDDFYLHHGHVGLQGGRIAFEELGGPILLRSEASSLLLHWGQNRIIALVGTLVATLQVYIAEAGSSFSLYFERSFDDSFSVCDSLAITTTSIRPVGCKEQEEGLLVMCGLRNGTVTTLLFDGGSSENERCECPLSLCESLTVGNTSVKVMTDTTRGSRAFIVCEQIVCTLEYLGGASPTNPAVINRLWLSDPNSPAFQQGPLNCFTQASLNVPHGCSTFAAGSLMYLMGSSLVMADVSSSPHPEMVPRRLPLMGTPTKILYSERLNRLIVLYTTTEILAPGAPRRKGTVILRRVVHPAIALIAPDEEPLRVDHDERDTLNVLDSTYVLSGEKFLGLMEWFPTDGKKQYHMLVVHTTIEQAGSLEAEHRLLFFSPIVDDVGDITLKQKITLNHEASICAVAPHGDSSLIYGCGNDIFIRVLDLENKKFKETMKITLRSPAAHISIQGSDIHVSTESHGHHILFVENDCLKPRWGDTTSRSSVYHLFIPETSLVITTDIECGLAGLWQPSQHQIHRTMPLIFEAFLPRSITRLCRIPRPLWQEKYSSEPAILGTSDDGTIYQLTVLDEASWRLLSYIQNMAKRESRICPYSDGRLHDQSIEPSMARKCDMHIDGDILIRLLERGGRMLLEDMLAGHGTEDTSDRWERLPDLISDAFKGKIPNGEVGESVLAWMRLLLLPAM